MQPNAGPGWFSNYFQSGSRLLCGLSPGSHPELTLSAWLGLAFRRAMTSKHFVNDPKTLVKESLQGLAYANPRVQFDPEYRVLYRKKVDENQVHVVSVSLLPFGWFSTCNPHFCTDKETGSFSKLIRAVARVTNLLTLLSWATAS